MSGIRLFLFTVAAAALASCSTTSGYRHQLSSLPSGAGGHAKTGRPYTVDGRTYYPLTTAYGYDQTGIASWYGPDFNGGRTADGEWYDMHAMSAAHPTLPLPTLVRVTNLNNGRQVVVRVNDRGPFVKNRLIDLSYAAAQELGFARKGTARVRVQALAGLKDEPLHARSRHLAPVATTAAPALPHPPVSAPPPSSPPVPKLAAGKVIPAHPSGAMYVQLGAFASVDNANRLSHALADEYRDIAVYSAGNGTARLYKVRIGPFENVHQIEKTVLSLQSLGIQDAIVVIE